VRESELESAIGITHTLIEIHRLSNAVTEKQDASFPCRHKLGMENIINLIQHVSCSEDGVTIWNVLGNYI
jgi:hypothetical protein